MKVGKPKSKRVSVRLRQKIQKASSNKQRKDRKEAKKNPQWRSRLKKDPGIPNLFPYKDKVLAEIEESKRKKEEDQQRRRDLARAQREGKKVGAGKGAEGVAEDEDEELVDAEVDDVDEDDEMEDDTNPMAALLASAQARAQKYQHEDEDEDEDDEEDEDEEEIAGPAKTKSKATATTQPAYKALPPQAIADPIKGVTVLVEGLEKTQEGIQQLLAYYQLPPLVTAGSDTTTRFLVDVARKRGRLSRGGIPNMHAAALTVLGDLHEERLVLPSLQQLQATSSAAKNKGKVQIVSELAQPFRIEGLFGGPSQEEEVEMETA